METEMDKFYPGNHKKLVNNFTSQLKSANNRGEIKASRKRRRSPCPPHPPLSPPTEILSLLDKPVFPDDITTQFQPLVISQGQPLDIISLLSMNIEYSHCNKSLVRFYRVGDRLVATEYVEETDFQAYFKGKHVLLICFYVPIDVRAYISYEVMEYSMFAKEMFCKYPDKFETVIAVKMRPNWSNNEAVFTHFVSAFSPSCLVVPFGDTPRIDAICRSIDLQGAWKGVLVGPHGLVVHDHLEFVSSTSFLDSFPFTHQYPTIDVHQNWRNETLDTLLGCAKLTRCEPKHDGWVSISVSDLAEKNKVVGLYVCGLGNYIPLLHRLYNECRNQNLDFEVVLVCPAFLFHYPPEVSQEAATSFLQDTKIPFWLWPFSYTLSCRLFDLTHGAPCDKLLIVSCGKLVELDGEKLVRKLGMHAYPFDRESVIQRALEQIKNLTLESLLEGGSLVRANKKPSHNNDDEVVVSVSHLKGENVILFLDSELECRELEELIDEHYDEIKRKSGGFEVVFVCLDETMSPPMEERISSKPWLVYGCDSRRVMRALSLWGRGTEPCLVAFGEDGFICSLHAEYALESHGSDAFPFAADLNQQIATELLDSLDLNYP